MSKSNSIKENSVTCWVDRLGLLSFAVLLLAKIRHDIQEVQYFTANRRLLNFLGKLAGKTQFTQINFHNRDFSLYDAIAGMKKSGPRSASPLPIEELPSLIPEIMSVLGPGFDRKKIELFFDQEVASDITPAIKLFYQMALTASTDSINPEDRYIAIIQDNYWVKSLAAHYRKNFISLRTYPNLKNAVALLYRPFKLIVEILVNSIGLIFFPRRPSEAKNADPKMAILYTHGVDANCKSDYFWLPYSDVKRENLVLYFKHHLRAPTKEVIKEVEANGVPWVDVSSRRFNFKPLFSFELNIFPTSFYIKKLFSLLPVCGAMLGLLFTRRRRAFLWFLSRTIHLLDDVYLFEAFFVLYNVKMHFGAYEAGRHMTASNLAIDRVGGIDLGHHWSNHDRVEVDIGKPHDVFFLWGPYYYRYFFYQEYFLVKNYVFTGYSYDYSFAMCKPKASAYRQKLLSQGAKFIIGFFDQSLVEEVSVWNQAQVKLYQYLLTEVINNTSVGLMIKPKKAGGPEGLARMYPSLKDVIQKACLTGRCLILNTNVFPSEAALASDLSIGMGVSSTPSLEAALAGIPSVTYNPEQCSYHPMYREGHNRVIFSDFDSLAKAIDNCRDGANARQIGDYSFVIKEVDPFCDGKAAQRTGQYIKSLLDAVGAGAAKDEAIKEANAAYRNNFGDDKVLDFPATKNRQATMALEK